MNLSHLRNTQTPLSKQRDCGSAWHSKRDIIEFGLGVRLRDLMVEAVGAPRKVLGLGSLSETPTDRRSESKASGCKRRSPRSISTIPGRDALDLAALSSRDEELNLSAAAAGAGKAGMPVDDRRLGAVAHHHLAQDFMRRALDRK